MQAYKVNRGRPRRRLRSSFASPHSARSYPADFLQASQLDELALRSSEDDYVDLFAKR